MSQWNEAEDKLYRQMVAEKLDQILVQARLTNGRMNKAELAIAVLQVGYAVGALIGGAVFAWIAAGRP